jgi:hypothetical protein
MKIQVTVCRCNYCGRTAVLINDYGSCPANCPGYFSNCKEFICDVPDDVLHRLEEKE